MQPAWVCQGCQSIWLSINVQHCLHAWQAGKPALLIAQHWHIAICTVYVEARGWLRMIQSIPLPACMTEARRPLLHAPGQEEC
jgi:hypothetical protein